MSLGEICFLMCPLPLAQGLQYPEPFDTRKIQRINSGKHAELHTTPFQPSCACQCSSWREMLPPAEFSVCSGTARRRPGGKNCLFSFGVSSFQRCSSGRAVSGRSAPMPHPCPKISEPRPTAAPALTLILPLCESSCRALFREWKMLLSAVCLEGLVI